MRFQWLYVVKNWFTSMKVACVSRSTTSNSVFNCLVAGMPPMGGGCLSCDDDNVYGKGFHFHFIFTLFS